jgi:hypothetical protein
MSTSFFPKRLMSHASLPTSFHVLARGFMPSHAHDPQTYDPDHPEGDHNSRAGGNKGNGSGAECDL